MNGPQDVQGLQEDLQNSQICRGAILRLATIIIVRLCNTIN